MIPGQVQQDYTVRLESFEGPLDLLLFLVRRSEVDLQDIPIAEITDQYLGMLGNVESVDVELAGEFLVMAATLVEIKSRTIAPKETVEGEDDATAPEDPIDPRADLIRQLLRFQRIRLAAERLEDGRVLFQRQLVVRVGSDLEDKSQIETGLDLEDVHVMDLAEAYERIASAINFDAIGDHRVAIDDTPIALHQADLVDQLTRRSGQALNLQDIFAGRKASHRVGLFLATLELIRMRKVDFLQEDEGPIRLTLRPVEDHERFVLEGDEDLEDQAMEEQIIEPVFKNGSDQDQQHDEGP
ncbi:MAG: segregation/condensation protein A [Phycisphaerales bacterium]|nr:segregation/condensation protein A [Phycisphaerales bacterium]